MIRYEYSRNLIFWLCDISTVLFKGQKHRGHSDIAITSNLKCRKERKKDVLELLIPQFYLIC